MKKPVRILAVLALLIFLVVFTWVMVAGPVTVWRILRYGDTNIDDFSQYPGRMIQAPSQPSALELDETAPIFHVVLPDLFGSGSLEDVLESNDTIAFLVLHGDPLKGMRIPSCMKPISRVTVPARFRRHFLSPSRSRPCWSGWPLRTGRSSASTSR